MEKLRLIVVEFCGTPGVGKSTLCEKILSELYTIGLKADSREEWLKRDQHSLLMKLCRHAYYYFSNFFRRYPTLIKKCANSEEKNLNKWLTKIIEADLFIISSKRNDIILFDEGIVQSVTSISHEKEITTDLLETSICAQKEIINRPYLIFNCYLDIPANIDRIRKRNRHDRFFNYSNEELPGQLQQKRRNIEKVLHANNRCKIVDLDMSNFENATSKAMNEIVSFYENNLC